ncbi:DUF2505 domain-containing protein [Nanchangia anserum]|uniref:DUF2505 domain-containing protein n=1 Tax=Nanchangia anserum TaxID=2692125 RepID=A0A8I0G6W6_9ACTO|nr:DUF2505 domain-containing protein [Nanchangia anserum]MBD3688920.1 DUF2505 domain-containing protein [Nanchangia anserum]QOX81184.1 DUF2505 domain-containing protein [Nanchangia anserum]
MLVDRAITYVSPPHLVASMLGDERFYALRADAYGLLHDVEVTCSRGDGDVHVLTRGRARAADLDARLSSLVPSFLTLTCVEVWEHGPRVGANGTLALDIAGVPTAITARSRLVEVEGRCVREFSGDVRCNLPLVGRSLEKAVVAHVGTLLDAEVAAERAYLGDAGCADAPAAAPAP